MQINLMLNGVRVSDDVAPDTLLIDFVRRHGCLSVKRGCETSNCGLCTVFWMTSRCCPVLCCRPRRRSQGDHAEGLQEEAARIRCLHRPIRAQSSAASANPGFIMNALALFPGKSIPVCRRNQRISFRQSLPLLRL